MTERIECLVYDIISSIIRINNEISQPPLRKKENTIWFDPMVLPYQSLSQGSTFDIKEGCYKPSSELCDKEKPVSSITFPIIMDSSYKNMAQLTSCLALLHKGLKNNLVISLRDIYYSEPSLYGNQESSNNTLLTVQAMLQKSRDSLNIISAERGWCSGALKIHVNSVNHGLDCCLSQSTSLQPYSHRQQTLIKQCFCEETLVNSLNFTLPSTLFSFPMKVNALIAQNSASQIAGESGSQNVAYKINTKAERMLIIEKETIFQRFNQILSQDTVNNSPYNLNNTIIMTSKGYPTFTSRHFINSIFTQHNQLPIYVLVDGDPYGIDIASKYIVGSRQQSLDCSFCLPTINYIGVRTSIVHRAVALSQWVTENNYSLQDLTDASSQPRSKMKRKYTKYLFNAQEDEDHKKAFLNFFTSYGTTSSTFADTFLTQRVIEDIPLIERLAIGILQNLVIESDNLIQSLSSIDYNHIQSMLKNDYWLSSPDNPDLLTFCNSLSQTQHIENAQKIFIYTKTMMLYELFYMQESWLKCEIESLLSISPRSIIDYCIHSNM